MESLLLPHKGTTAFLEASVVNFHCSLSSPNGLSSSREQTVLVGMEQIGNKWPTTTHNDEFLPVPNFTVPYASGHKINKSQSAQGTHCKPRPVSK